ncbi:MAG: FAD:protein FMN transferase [Thermoguttaceae bacterium]
MPFCEFQDELMQGQFRLQLYTDDLVNAEKVSREIFTELKRLESLLSRFVPGSDVARLNRLAQNEAAIIALETFRCLETAEQLRRTTEGLFDVSFRSTRENSQKPAYDLQQRPPRVRSLCPQLQIDLGGIGKGFALDQAALMLEHYGLTNALLWADSSTVLALDSVWSVEVGNADQMLQITRQSVSCSGTAIRGEHVCDPHSGQFQTQQQRCWVLTETATIADALSTAFILAEKTQIATIQRHQPGQCEVFF